MKPNKKIQCISNIQYALKNIWKWDKKFYLFSIPLIRSVYKELHADHEMGAADNK